MKVNQTIICDATTREETPEGFLKVILRATRTGPMRYSVNDIAGVEDIHGTGYVWIGRKPEDVFDANSLATLRECSITDEHPESRKVTAANYKQETTGHITGDAYHDERNVYVPAIIKDADAVSRVKSNKRQLSVGADAEVVRESFIQDGQPCDYKFQNIIYNHVSVVGRGRAGNAQILDEKKESDVADEKKDAEIQRLTTLNDTLTNENAQLKKRLDDIDRDTVINDAKEIDPDFKPKAGWTAKQIKVALINDADITDESDDALVNYAFRNIKKQPAMTTTTKSAPVVKISQPKQPAAVVTDGADEGRPAYNQWDD